MRAAVATLHRPPVGNAAKSFSFFRRVPRDRALDVIDTAGLRRPQLNVVTGGAKAVWPSGPQLLLTEWGGETVDETEKRAVERVQILFSNLFTAVGLLRSFLSFVAASEETAARSASKLLGWCAKDMIVQTGQI